MADARLTTTQLSDILRRLEQIADAARDIHTYIVDAMAARRVKRRQAPAAAVGRRKSAARR